MPGCLFFFHSSENDGKVEIARKGRVVGGGFSFKDKGMPGNLRLARIPRVMISSGSMFFLMF